LVEVLEVLEVLVPRRAPDTEGFCRKGWPFVADQQHNRCWAKRQWGTEAHAAFEGVYPALSGGQGRPAGMRKKHNAFFVVRDTIPMPA